MVMKICVKPQNLGSTLDLQLRCLFGTLVSACLVTPGASFET